MLSRLRLLLEGSSFILCTDEERVWYESYILGLINSNKNRPLVPFFSLKSMYPKSLESENDMALLNDLLELTFPNGYIFFYIGRADKKLARLVNSKDDSLLWLFDEQLQNTFYLSSNDKELDFKLICLFKLLNECVNGLLFSKFEL